MWFFVIGYMVIFIVAPIYMFIVWVIRFTIIDMLVYSAIWLLAQVGIQIKIRQFTYLLVNIIAVIYGGYMRYQVGDAGCDIIGWVWGIIGLLTLAFTWVIWTPPDPTVLNMIRSRPQKSLLEVVYRQRQIPKQ